jgi:capsule polysaccharide export protein KpsE/RkpR
MITRYGIHKLLKISIFTIVILIVVGYALFATHDFIIGPTIVISEPLSGSTFPHQISI